MMSLRKSRSIHAEKTLSAEEQKSKINEVRKLMGPWSDKLPSFCSDASISRYLRARNWNAKKASEMLRETLRWRLEYKPESISWEDIAHEAENGKLYLADYRDKYGRTVLVMRPGVQNTSSTRSQIKYFVYCMENAILNLAADQEQMVWLIDFQGWKMGSISVQVTRETAHVLQTYYPERLAFGILYNPPRIFESFLKVVKSFLEHQIYRKVKFVYSDNTESQKILSDLFDLHRLETAFGGRNSVRFDLHQYAQQMKDADQKRAAVFACSPSAVVLSRVQPHECNINRSEPSICKAHSEDASSEVSSSCNIPSSDDHEDISKFGKDSVQEQFTCKSSVVAETEHQPDHIQMREPV